MARCYALLGWSLPVIESAQKLGKPFVVVSFDGFKGYAAENDIPFVSWDFDSWGDQSNSLLLKEQLDAFGADVAIPLFEETVEWAGALNSIYRDDPRVLNRAFLFRNKAMMKRKALLGGLRVGLFEEVHSVDQVRDFYQRLNEAELHLPGEATHWLHCKPFDAAGTVGHVLIREESDIDVKLKDVKFPLLAESHLAGYEFSTEAFIHAGKVRYVNITEYVRLGHSNFVPCGPQLEAKRHIIEREIQKLVDVFGIEYGMIHPEWFLNDKDEIAFGEVACRIPGGHILDLFSRAFDIDALQAFILCHDPNATEEELKAILPEPGAKPVRYVGSLMVYPDRGHITDLDVPDELVEDPYFASHTLTPPVGAQKIAEREGFGNHFGTVYFEGEDPDRMRELLRHYEEVSFYV